jgi:hypothetical protein
MPFFLKHESPYFIKLKIVHRQIAETLIQKPLAVIASGLEKIQDCALLNITEPRSAAHAVAFNKAMQNQADLFHREPNVSERLLLGLAVELPALLAEVSLNFLLAVLTGFDCFNFAIVAGHFGLSFSRSKPIMKTEVGIAA